MPRALRALAMTEAEGICVSFRDQSADWSWESVIPLCKSKGDADCYTSDIGHWFAMTGFFHELRCKSGQRGESTPPYNHTLCRAGPVCPAVGALENRLGSSGRPTPTLHSTIELRRGGALSARRWACFPFPSCISPGFAAYWGCSILHQRSFRHGNREAIL